MAKRNRKKTQAGFIFPVPLAGFVALLVGVGLLHLCLQSNAEALGRDIKALESRRDQLKERLQQVQLAWARMQSPANLEKSLKEHGLVMTWPNPGQIVRVKPDGTAEIGLAARRPGEHLARVDRIVMND